MTKEALDSDRINYLIWRYLIESDYKETAVRLQKEWDQKNPHQELPFAPHVQNHALVDILNRGLLYNVQEREAAQTENNVAAAAVGFFGPMEAPPSPAADADFENVRKRQIIDGDHPQNHAGPPSKKARLSNGYENGFETTPMDIDEDQNGDEHAYPSPEQVPSPIVATNGPSEGTQLDRFKDLSAETSYLELSNDSTSSSTVLLHCEFHPRNSMILAAAGTDALARMWRLSQASPDLGDSNSPAKVSSVFYNNLLEESSSAVTATFLTWSHDGNFVAVASEPLDDGSAKVEIWQTDGKQIASYPQFDSPIINLCWNTSSTACLAISPYDEGRGTTLAVLTPFTGESVRYPLIQHALSEQPLDAIWKDGENFIIGGGSRLEAYSYSNNTISPAQKYQVEAGQILSKIAYDLPSGLIATASESGKIHIWDEAGQRRSFDAHTGDITSLIWQPLPSSVSNNEGSERLLASAGEDGAISIWNARLPDNKAKYSMTMDSGVVALAFTLDGSFIAGADHQGVKIWKTEEVNMEYAKWRRGDDAGWRTPQSSDSSSTADEDHFSLCWNAGGNKIAYGVNNRLAIINFR